MGDTELVEAGYSRLYTKYQKLQKNGLIERRKPFHEWANGRILLTNDETQTVFQHIHVEYVDTKLYMFHAVFEQLGEERLRAAVTFEPITHRMVVIATLIVCRRE